MARLCSGVGVTLLRAAILWQVYELTGDELHLGIVGLVQFGPALALSLVAGALADRGERVRIVRGAQLLSGLCGAAFAFLAWDGETEIATFYALVLASAIASTFENPAGAALVPQLVPRAVFPAAVRVNSAVRIFAFMTGPVAMGFARDAAGPAAPYLLHVVLIGVSQLALLRVRPLPDANPETAFAPRGELNWAAVREGLAFVRRQPVVLGCMSLDMFAVLFGGATAMLPVYASDILAVGPRGYGVLSASLELGAVLMAVFLLVRQPRARQGQALLWAVAAFGLATVVFGLSRWLPLSVAAYMVAGMADYVSVVMRQTAVQLSTPDRLRGRVSAVNLVFIGASNQLGAAESGFVAAFTSPEFSVVSGGVGALLVVALVAWRNPTLRRYRASA